MTSVFLLLAATGLPAHAQEPNEGPVLWEEAPEPLGEPVPELGDLPRSAPPDAAPATPGATPAAPPPPAPCPDAAEEPFSPTVEVWIRGTVRGVRYELLPVRSVSPLEGDDAEYYYDARRVEPVATCHGSCRVVVPAGRYRLRTVARHDLDVYPGARELTLRRDTELVVTPPSARRRAAGLRTAVLGTVLAPVGFVTLLAGIAIEDEEDMECGAYESTCTNDRTNGAVYAGAIMSLVGGIMIPIGWATFGRNRYPRVRARPAAHALDEPATEARLKVGPRRFAGGYGVGLRYAF